MVEYYTVSKTDDGRGSWGLNIYQGRLHTMVAKHGAANLALRVICDRGSLGQATIDIPYAVLSSEILPRVEWESRGTTKRLTFEVARGSYEFTWRRGVHWTPPGDAIHYDMGDRSVFIENDQVNAVFSSKDIGRGHDFGRLVGGRVIVLSNPPQGWSFMGEIPIDEAYIDDARPEWRFRAKATTRPIVRYTVPVQLAPLAGKLEAFPAGRHVQEFQYPRPLSPSDAQEISVLGRAGAGVPFASPTALGIFKSEFKGAVSYQRASLEGHAAFDHGHVVEALAKLFSGPEFGRGNKRPFDLVVGRPGTTKKALFEVKSASDTTSIYEAIGQLMVYSEMIEGHPARIAVFPDSLPDSTVELLERLGISTLKFGLSATKVATFTSDPVALVRGLLSS